MSIRDEEENFEAELYKSNAWGVNYADFMSFLMIFFLILFSFYLTASNSPVIKAEWEKVFSKTGEPFKTGMIETAPEMQIETVLKNPVFVSSGDLSVEDLKHILVNASKKTSRVNSNINFAQDMSTQEYVSFWTDRIIIPVRIKKSGIKYYRVKQGDSLWNISLKETGDPWMYLEIAKFNKIPVPGIISPGNIIALPKINSPID